MSLVLYYTLSSSSQKVKSGVSRFSIFLLAFLQIREETDTRVDLPTESSSSDVIVITGRKENVQKAKARIQEIEKEMVSAPELFLETLGYS